MKRAWQAAVGLAILVVLLAPAGAAVHPVGDAGGQAAVLDGTDRLVGPGQTAPDGVKSSTGDDGALEIGLSGAPGYVDGAEPASFQPSEVPWAPLPEGIDGADPLSTAGGCIQVHDPGQVPPVSVDPAACPGPWRWNRSHLSVEETEGVDPLSAAGTCIVIHDPGQVPPVSVDPEACPDPRGDDRLYMNGLT